jgi:hypothetical protein
MDNRSKGCVVVVYIVWCKSPFGVDFMSVWEDITLAEREAASLNKQDFEARYFVTSETTNLGVH